MFVVFVMLYYEEHMLFEFAAIALLYLDTSLNIFNNSAISSITYVCFNHFYRSIKRCKSKSI